MDHGANDMAGHLDVYIEPEKPVCVYQDEDNQQTERLVQVEGCPEDITVWIFELPPYNRAHGEVNGIPKA